MRSMRIMHAERCRFGHVQRRQRRGKIHHVHIKFLRHLHCCSTPVQAQCGIVRNMVDMEKVASAASRKSERTPSLSRVYSAPHMDNQSAFYATSKDEGGQETDAVVPSYAANDDDNQDLESGNSDGSDQDGNLQPTQTSRSQRSERDPKLVCIILIFPRLSSNVSLHSV